VFASSEEPNFPLREVVVKGRVFAKYIEESVLVIGSTGDVDDNNINNDNHGTGKYIRD
jgi:hypothetical protein